MKILILTNSDIGLFRFRRELLETLVERHEVYISLPQGGFIQQLQELGCNYIDTGFDRRGMDPVEDLKLLRSYVRLLKQLCPDIVLTYTIKPTIYGGIACRYKRVKYIPTITGLGTAVENPGILQKVLLRLYRYALVDASCVFFQNEDNLTYFQDRKLVGKRTELVSGSGVNLNEHCYEEYPDRSPGEDKFLFIGRVMKDKGIEELFEAVQKVRKRYPRVEFHLLGGMDEDRSGEVAGLEETGDIRYWGQQEEVHPFIRECSAVVLPSYHEGMANVLLEASAAGRPVLASDIPGCRETFDEGVSGFGFAPKDADSLYRTICRFIELPIEKKREMGRRAREKMEREFDRRLVVDAYMEEITRADKEKL